ncbi:hypothetical protein T439DRAFT_348501 [Meredithblackwellia eburnea MCA 4105]
MDDGDEFWGDEIEVDEEFESQLQLIEEKHLGGRGTEATQQQTSRPEFNEHWSDGIEVDDKIEAQLQLIEERHLAGSRKGNEVTQRDHEDECVNVSTAVPQHVAIEIEEEGESANDVEPVVYLDEPCQSLFEQYRSTRGLSVTDLVSTLWCEYQHSYRLASKAHLPPSQRPAEIRTASGAVVPVDQKRNVAREKILVKGREVHKVLEVEAMGEQEEVKVAVQAKEEWWALRLVNTMVCLQTLLDTGKAREIPVMGFVDSFLVFGVIDEVDRRTLPPTEPLTSNPVAPKPPPTPKKKNHVTSSQAPIKTKEDIDSQTKLERFFSPTASQVKAETPAFSPCDTPLSTSPPLWKYVVSDTKTRYNHSLPPKADSRASRLQLMLYHRLLSTLLTRPRPTTSSATCDNSFPWASFFDNHSLNPDASLSDAFLETIFPVIARSCLEDIVGPANTLREFVDALLNYGDLLGANHPNGMLSKTLEISYRLRNSSTRKWPRRARQGWRKARVSGNKNGDEAELQKALQKSTREVESSKSIVHVLDVDSDEEAELEKAIAESLKTPGSGGGGSQVEDLTRSENELPQLNTDDDDETDLALPFLVHPSVAQSSPFVSRTKDLQSHSVSGFESDDLPLNSQGGHPEPLIEVEVAITPRYNLRKRRKLEVPTSLASSPSPPMKVYKSAAVPSSPASKHTPSAPSQPPAPRELSPSPPPEELKEGTLIGVEEFEYDQEEIEAHLVDVVRLWRGDRKPRGVALEQTGRCRTCEFETGCEWREAKANEILERNRQRREVASKAAKHQHL